MINKIKFSSTNIMTFAMLIAISFLFMGASDFFKSENKELKKEIELLNSQLCNMKAVSPSGFIDKSIDTIIFLREIITSREAQSYQSNFDRYFEGKRTNVTYYDINQKLLSALNVERLSPRISIGARIVYGLKDGTVPYNEMEFVQMIFPLDENGEVKESENIQIVTLPRKRSSSEELNTFGFSTRKVISCPPFCE